MAANRLKLNTDKTELLWAGSKSGSAPLGSKEPPLRLGSEVIAASDHVRLLGVRVSSDLSLQKHACFVCSSCFYWLCQILKIRRSLDTESAKTLVHAFNTFRVDYCNTVLADSPKIVMDRLQCVLKCRSLRRQPNEEVRPRPDTFTSHRIALAAGRFWAGPVQARSDCSPVHAAQGYTISMVECRLLHAVLRHRQSSTSSHRQPPSARRDTTLPEQVSSSGLLRRRPRRLELSTSSPP